MEDPTFEKYFGANWTNFSDFDEETSIEYILPDDLTEISDSSLLGVLAYFIVFVVSALGHIFALTSLWKHYRVKRTRIYLLLVHLSIADLIVCMIIVPTEIFWRIIVQWEGGNFLCKFIQCLRAFGLYLSSLILICLSVDRFISIIFPLKAIGVAAYRRIQWMIIISWIVAAIFSAPQAVFFSVEFHPRFVNYKQCVTSAFHDEENFNKVKIYSAFSLVIMYFVPLVVIVLTYTVIFVKLAIQSREQFISSLVRSDNDFPSPRENSLCTVVNELGEVSVAAAISKPTFHLRASSNAQANLTKAKMRTLLMTIVIVVAFIVWWTPYAVMTIWYIVDWEEAEKVDPRIQDAFFLMVISNSCINPFIYGGFSRRSGVGNGLSCTSFF